MLEQEQGTYQPVSLVLSGHRLLLPKSYASRSWHPTEAKPAAYSSPDHQAAQLTVRGCSVWLTSLSKFVPKSAQLDGLDISFDAAPPAGSLPPNVTLRKWNVKEAIPLEFTEAYDIVHIRNFAFVLQDGDIPGVLRRLVQLISEWVSPDAIGSPADFGLTKKS